MGLPFSIMRNPTAWATARATARAECEACEFAKSIAFGGTYCAKKEGRVAVAFVGNVCPLPVPRFDHTFTAAAPATWEELHTRALVYTGDAESESVWIAAFAVRVPSVNCSCRSDWRVWAGANAPDLTNASTYFAWTVASHNAVNVRLSKPTLTTDEALAIWNP